MSTFRSFAIIVLFTLTACKSNHSENPVSPSVAKPDLVIDTVTYTRLPNCWQGYPSGVICGPPTFGFTLRIRNLGTADVSSPFFVQNSRSKWDFDNRYLSLGQRVNDPPTTIPINGTLDLNITSDVEDSLANVFIVVNPNYTYNTRVDTPLVDEVNFSNNSYTVTLKW